MAQGSAGIAHGSAADTIASALACTRIVRQLRHAPGGLRALVMNQVMLMLRHHVFHSVSQLQLFLFEDYF